MNASKITKKEINVSNEHKRRDKEAKIKTNKKYSKYV